MCLAKRLERAGKLVSSTLQSKDCRLRSTDCLVTDMSSCAMAGVSPLRPAAEQGVHVAGVRYRAWQPPSCLHPTIPVDSPLVFDIIDRASSRAVGGCTYHVGHPGGLNPSSYPLNAYEAESRRAGRFLKQHSGGTRNVPDEEYNGEMPITLDLREESSRHRLELADLPHRLIGLVDAVAGEPNACLDCNCRPKATDASRKFASSGYRSLRYGRSYRLDHKCRQP